MRGENKMNAAETNIFYNLCKEITLLKVNFEAMEDNPPCKRIVKEKLNLISKMLVKIEKMREQSIKRSNYGKDYRIKHLIQTV